VVFQKYSFSEGAGKSHQALREKAGEMSFLLYMGKRCIYALFTLWGVVTLVFFLFNVLPDPAQLSMGQRTDAQSIEAARREMGLDRPVLHQYLQYLNDLSFFSVYTEKQAEARQTGGLALLKTDAWSLYIKYPYLRSSYHSKKPVAGILAEAFEGTFYLALFSMWIAVVLGISMGIAAGLCYNRWPDRLVLFFTTIGISLPSFFAAILIAWIFGYVLHPYTGLSMTGSLVDYTLENGRHYAWKNILLPGIALGIRPLAIISQLTRSSMLDILGQDFITTAYAKGLSKARVIFFHALPNALNPVITSVSGWFASLLAGAFFVEYIFSWKGIGKITVDALEKADYPVVMGAVVLVAVIFIVLNIVVDLLYKLLDPRIGL
jgi:peptide/nickel transport system permease protein